MSLSDSSSCSCHIGAPTCYDRDSSEVAQLILRWLTLPRLVQQATLLIANVPVQSSSDFSTISNKPCVRLDAINGGANCKKNLKTHTADGTQVFSPWITSNSFRDNSLKLNDLSSCDQQQPKTVCTPVCTNSDSAAAIPWQPSSPIGRINAAWPHLPPHIRDTILTIVDAVPLGQERTLVEGQPSVQSTINNRINLDGISKDILRRTILKALRHTPELYRLNMDADGWVDSFEMGQLINQLTGTDSVPGFEEVLRVFQEIELTDRVQFKHGFVRAAYGHSTERFAPSISVIPDQPLFHGTSADNWSMIEYFGLSPAKRRFVQLTTDFDYLSQIASSHSRSPNTR